MEKEPDKLLIDVARLSDEGDDLEGEVDIIDINEELVKPFGGVRYRLHARVYGTELLVTGHLEQDFDLVCSRCGKDFDTTISVDDFTASVEINDKTDFVDLTSDARECIILSLPTYPLCDEACPGIAQKTIGIADDRWQALEAVMPGKEDAEKREKK